MTFDQVAAAFNYLFAGGNLYVFCVEPDRRTGWTATKFAFFLFFAILWDTGRLQ